MVDKCLKCGADLSADAEFCPLCGTKKAAKPAQTEQPAPVQPEPVQTQSEPVKQETVEPQPIAPPSKPKKVKPPKPPRAPGESPFTSIANMVFSKMVIMLGICIGILLAWIGTIIGYIIGNTTTVSTTTTIIAGGSQTVNNTGVLINGILTSLGLVGIGFLLLGGGLLNKDFDKYIRIGMIISGGLVLANGLRFVSITTIG